MLARQCITLREATLGSMGIAPKPPSTRCRSKFESLPTELRLQIYSLLLDGKPECCLLEKCEISRTYSIPTLYPAILAVNRSISAEAYPVLYGENTFLFLGTTRDADQLLNSHQFFGRLAGLPTVQKSSLLPERSRRLIKHIAAAPLDPSKIDWVHQLLQLAPTTKTIEFDFWVVSYQSPRVLEPFARISILHASIPAIKSLINASTQTFRIGIRDVRTYYNANIRYPRRKRTEVPSLQLAVVDLKGLDDVQEKRRMVHKVLHLIFDMMGQRPLMPENSVLLEKRLMSVEKRVLLHSGFAGFWSSDEFRLHGENQRWIPVDSNGQIVEIGSGYKSITWRRWGIGPVKNNVPYDYSDY